jgi:hypothetical protein
MEICLTVRELLHEDRRTDGYGALLRLSAAHELEKKGTQDDLGIDGKINSISEPRNEFQGTICRSTITRKITYDILSTAAFFAASNWIST